MARALSAMAIPAAFPKLAKKARLFPSIRARLSSVLLFG